jgi:predicted negative regulator of RcsB-dependent stress response
MNLLSDFLALPMKIKAGMVATLALILALSGALGWTYWKGQQSAQPKIEAAEETAAVSDLTARGAIETTRQVEIVVRQAADAYRVSSDLAVEAAKSEDANAPLDPARAARLRRSDRELCSQRPTLVGCEAFAASGDASSR